MNLNEAKNNILLTSVFEINFFRQVPTGDQTFQVFQDCSSHKNFRPTPERSQESESTCKSIKILCSLQFSTKPLRSHGTYEASGHVAWKEITFLPCAHSMAGSWNHWKHGGDYIAWIITVLGAVSSNLAFIFDLNYFLFKLKTSRRQRVSFLLETKHKFLWFKMKSIPRMPVPDSNSSLKILVGNAQLSVALATGWS